MIALTGVKSSMKCTVQMHTEGGTPVTIKTAQCGKDKLTIEFSANPNQTGAAHEIEYWIFI